MKLFRWLFLVYLILGAVAGFTAGALWPDNTPAVATVDDPRYQRDTSHIQTYYQLLRVSDPAPKGWVKGYAGDDYCWNLGNWFAAAQRSVSKGHPRTSIILALTPHWRYEANHGWLTATDVNRLVRFTAETPVILEEGLTIEILDMLFRKDCERNRDRSV